MNKELIRIIVSSILFIISLVINNIYLMVLSYIIVSFPIYINAFKNIRNGEIFDENLLMIIATLGAFYIGENEEALFVMLLYSLGEYISDKAIDNSEKEISKLMDLRVDSINIKGKGIVPIKEAKEGDIFIVKPGEKIPLDGIILKGSTHLDTSSLTGESIPEKKTKNDTVLSGTINLDSLIEIKATTSDANSTASVIIKMLEEGENNKSQSEKFITKFAKVYTPIVVTIALIIAISPYITGGDAVESIYKAIEMLVISCPCALVISVPLSYFAGIGKSAHEGILLKGSNSIDILDNVDTIIFDKTGTITEGTFKVRKYEGDKDLLKLAYIGEYNSNHPIATSIKEYVNLKDNIKVSNYKEYSGMGTYSVYKSLVLLVGNSKLMEKYKIKYKKLDIEGTIIYVAYNNKYIGYLLISDAVKNNAKDVLESIDIKNKVLLSGDNLKTTKMVSEEIRISEYYGELLPQDKMKYLKEYMNAGKVIFVGDGINDAPAIKMADIGIAMGLIGSDATIDASDIVIMNDDLESINKSIKIASITKKIVMENIVFAIGFKVLMLILAMVGITPIWLATFADVGVTLLAILNSLRIFMLPFTAK